MEIIENPVIVTCIKNPFDPLNSTETRALSAGKPVREYLDVFYPEISADYDIVIAIDGCLIETDNRLDLICGAGTSLAFSTVPQGGKRGILGLLVVIVAAVATWYIGGAGGWAAAGSWFGVSAATAAQVGYTMMVVAGTMLLNAFVPAASADMALGLYGGADSFQKSISYGWGVDKNSDLQGGPAPVIYGVRRVTPPVIGRYVETIGDKQYLNLLYLIADHAVDSITDIRIDGNPIANYQNVLVETRLGGLDQPVIQFFSDVKEDIYVGAKLSTDWVTRQTKGNLVEGLGIAVACPGGLFYQNAQGGLSETSVEVEAEFRKAGDPAWIRLQSWGKVTRQVASYRWSGGYWDNGYWTELEAGSTVPADHQEGDVYTPDESVWRYIYGNDVYGGGGGNGGSSTDGRGGGEGGDAGNDGDSQC